MIINDISILFSGGPDSTLASLYALDRAAKVHLLTYHHTLMSRINKNMRVVEELKKEYGEERVIYHEADINSLFRRCYFSGFFKHILKYRTFYIPWICGGCKLTMHATTIAYNMTHNIRVTYDGAHEESSPYFPAQTREYISVMKKFYESYGMEYECPIYYIKGTDGETAKRGILSTKDTKKEHVFFSTQHTCLVGLLIHAHARLYYRPFRGENRMQHIAGEFLDHMINECRLHLP